MNNRVIANDVYLPVLRELLEAGEEVPLTISGGSMSPFLAHERDKVLLAPVGERLRRGDMAIFQRRNGRYILHRIYRVTGDGACYFVGDAQTAIEGPISREQIFGTVKAVCRKERWMTQEDLVWRFFQYVWLWMRPVRGVAFRCYRVFRPLKFQPAGKGRERDVPHED